MTNMYGPEKNGTSVTGKRVSIDATPESESLEIPSALPPPPDGGWGWVIVFAAFMTCLVVDGNAYSFSPSLIVFSEYFNEPKGKVAWINSLMCGTTLMTGPIASALVNKFGCRPVLISGAIIASAAYAATPLATSIIYMIIFQGLIAGFGLGLMYLPSIVCVGYYFEKRRAIAMGLSVCGTGVGTIVCPPIATFLISKITWKGYNLCVSGALLSLVAMGSLMRPLEVLKMKRKDLIQRIEDEKESAKEIGELYGSTYCFVTHADTVTADVSTLRPASGKSLGVATVASNRNIPMLATIQEGEQLTEEDVQAEMVVRGIKDDEEMDDLNAWSSSKLANASTRSLMEMNRIFRNLSVQNLEKVQEEEAPPAGTAVSLEHNLSSVNLLQLINVVPAVSDLEFTNFAPSSPTPSRSQVKPVDEDPQPTATEEKVSPENIALPPLARQDIFYSGKINELEEFKDQGSMGNYRESTFNILETTSKAILEVLEASEEVVLPQKGLCAKCYNPVTHLIDFSLLKNPVFLFMCIANLIAMLGFYAPFLYLPASALDKKVDEQLTTFLISSIGIASTTGRVLSGFLGSIPGVNVLWVSNVALLTAALCVAGVPFAFSFEGFVSIAVVFGFSTAIFLSLTSIVIVELLGLRNLTNAFGLLLLFKGMASIFGAPLTGTIYDLTQSYRFAFFLAGGLMTISACMFFFIPLVAKCAPDPQAVVVFHTSEDYLVAIPEENEDDTSIDGEGILFAAKRKSSLPKF